MNSMKLKQINVDLIKTALKSADFGTKNSIAQATGLSVGTCKNILEELVNTGEAVELEQGPSTGGRPSRRFCYNENFAFSLLLYGRIEGQRKSLVFSVVNMLGKEVLKGSRDFDDISISEIEGVAEEVLEKFPRIEVLSLGIPGVVRDGGIIGSCDFGKLEHVPLQAKLNERLGRTTVVENDVNATAIGYYNRLESSNPESLVYIYYPENGMPGAGIVINGKSLRGKTSFAGEISYMPGWLEREEQGDAQRNHKLMANYIIDTILAVNCLINPQRIVLSGQWFTDELMSDIYGAAEKATPQGHTPEILFEPDYHESYMDGLKHAGLEKLSCRFEVVEK